MCMPVALRVQMHRPRLFRCSAPLPAPPHRQGVTAAHRLAPMPCPSRRSLQCGLIRPRWPRMSTPSPAAPSLVPTVSMKIQTKAPIRGGCDWRRKSRSATRAGGWPASERRPTHLPLPLGTDPPTAVVAPKTRARAHLNSGARRCHAAWPMSFVARPLAAVEPSIRRRLHHRRRNCFCNLASSGRERPPRQTRGSTVQRARHLVCGADEFSLSRTRRLCRIRCRRRQGLLVYMVLLTLALCLLSLLLPAGVAAAPQCLHRLPRVR
jgi:hypothetical protein